MSRIAGTSVMLSIFLLVGYFMRRRKEIRATHEDHILRGQTVRCVLFRLGIRQIWAPNDLTYHYACAVHCLLDRKLLCELHHVCCT